MFCAQWRSITRVVRFTDCLGGHELANVLFPVYFQHESHNVQWLGIVSPITLSSLKF